VAGHLTNIWEALVSIPRTPKKEKKEKVKKLSSIFSFGFLSGRFPGSFWVRGSESLNFVWQNVHECQRLLYKSPVSKSLFYPGKREENRWKKWSVSSTLENSSCWSQGEPEILNFSTQLCIRAVLSSLPLFLPLSLPGSLGRTGVWTQDLVLAKQAHYHLSHVLSPSFILSGS
jgi:hypothetical protein